jgi:hypothetical protein
VFSGHVFDLGVQSFCNPTPGNEKAPNMTRGTQNGALAFRSFLEDAYARERVDMREGL